MFRLLVLPIILSTFHLGSSMDCSKSECLKLADPLVREPRYIFPDNMEDIRRGCNTWDAFVNCLKHYTEQCFNDEDRRRFNNAVESPIENIHELCMNNKYQNEYLQFAPCIKSTITERSHCGPQYQMLVDQVSQRGNALSKSTLCCLHDKFEQCIQRETRRLCDGGVQNGQAARFSQQILDKALRFIEDQCVNYVPNSGDCGYVHDSIPSTDILSMSTIPSEVYPWSTIQEQNIIKEARNPSYRGSTSNMSPTYSWTPTANVPSNEITQPVSSSSVPDTLGSRTRPASYGRASSWAESQGYISSSPVPQNNFQMFSERMPITTTPRTYWSTTPSWNAMKKYNAELGSLNNNKDQTSRQIHRVDVANYQTTVETTHWYPAAGSHLSNDVEEPNQQGLRVQKNNANSFNFPLSFVFSLMVIKVLMT